MKAIAVALLVLSQLITITRLAEDRPGWQAFQVSIRIPSDVVFSAWFYYTDLEHRSYLLVSGTAVDEFTSTWYFVNFSCGRFTIVVGWRDGGYEMTSESVDLTVPGLPAIY